MTFKYAFIVPSPLGLENVEIQKKQRLTYENDST